MIFYTHKHNGVIAVISEEVLEGVKERSILYEQLLKQCIQHGATEKKASFGINKGLLHMDIPTFTFVEQERFDRYPALFTGSYREFDILYKRLMERGDKIKPEGFYVPFSNGLELGMRGAANLANELRFKTTRTQFRQTFGFSLGELRVEAGAQ